MTSTVIFKNVPSSLVEDVLQVLWRGSIHPPSRQPYPFSRWSYLSKRKELVHLAHDVVFPWRRDCTFPSASFFLDSFSLLLYSEWIYLFLLFSVKF